MSKVVVDAGGRRVEIEHEVSTPAQLSGLIRRAHGLWERTTPATGGVEGPAYGFAVERRPSAGYDPVGNGEYGRPHAPVTAQS